VTIGKAEKPYNYSRTLCLKVFSNIIIEGVEYFENRPLVLDALTGLFSYLDTILIKDKVLESSRFQVYDPEASRQRYMMIDNQAIYHLELLSSPFQAGKGIDFSLFGCIDRTVTPGGRRLLRRWMCAPLYDQDKIIARQEAVDDLLTLRI